MDILKRVLFSIISALGFTISIIGLMIAMPTIIEWLNSVDGRIQLGVVIFVISCISAYINSYQIF